MGKEELYKRIKIGGAISFIPVILATGPLAGYFIGDYIQKKFGLPPYLTFIFAGLGFIGSITETINIIRFVLKMDKKD